MRERRKGEVRVRGGRERGEEEGDNMDEICKSLNWENPIAHATQTRSRQGEGEGGEETDMPQCQH